MTPADEQWMEKAFELAERGRGYVEPNPMVGCVLVRDGRLVGQGWHAVFGGPHAEAAALADAGPRAQGATAYVTLEPCAHFGKTPPCADALIAARVRRVVIAAGDPFPKVAGRGTARLRAAGVVVVEHVAADRAAEFYAPYFHWAATRLPWVIAKWAMTLDGKIATAAGDSQWISQPASRARVHQLRGRVDAVIVGSRTAQLDNPRLTVRPQPGSSPPPRTPLRVVVDSQACLPADSQLAATAADVPVLVAAAAGAAPERVAALRARRVEVVELVGHDHAARLRELLELLRERGAANVLVEGGGGLLGGLFDAELINEVHAFISPRLLGGAAAPAPLGGVGRETIAQAARVTPSWVEVLDGDLYLRGYVQPKPPSFRGADRPPDNVPP